MKVFEFFIREYGNLLIFDAEKYTTVENVDLLKQKIKNGLDSINSGTTEEEFSKHFDNLISSDIYNDKKVEPLLKSAKTLSWFNIEDEDIKDEKLLQLENLIKQEEGNKILPFCWVLFKRKLLELGERTDLDVAEFLSTIFDKYDYLIDLEDFFFVSHILWQDMIHSKMRTDIIAPVLEKAVVKFPRKIAIQRTLGNIYYWNKLYDNALPIYKNIIDKNIANSGDWDDFVGSEEFISIIINVSVIYNKANDLENAMKYVTYVIEHPPLSDFGNGVEPDTSGIFEAYLIRMQINLRKKQNPEQVKLDFEMVKNAFDENYQGDPDPDAETFDLGEEFSSENMYKADYSDVIAYIKKSLKK